LAKDVDCRSELLLRPTTLSYGCVLRFEGSIPSLPTLNRYNVPNINTKQ